MAPTIKTEASIQKTDRKRGKEPRGHSTEYKRDKLIDKVRNACMTKNGVPYDPEELVAEYERAMDVKLVNKDTTSSLYSVGKVIDDVWHLHLEDMADFRVFCNGAKIAHNPAGAADTPAENIARFERFSRFKRVYTKMYGHSPSDDYYYTHFEVKQEQEGVQGACPLQEERGWFQLFCNMLDGKTNTFYLKSDKSPVRELFEKVSRRIGIEMGHIRLIHSGRQIDEMDAPIDKFMKMDATIHLTLRLGGC